MMEQFMHATETILANIELMREQLNTLTKKVDTIANSLLKESHLNKYEITITLK